MAKTSLALTLVVLPLRYRWIIQTRPTSPIYSDYTDFLLFPGDLFLILTLLFWLASFICKPGSIQAGPTSISLPLLLLTAVGLISTLSSVDMPLSLYHAGRLLFLAGFYLFVLNHGSTAALILPIAIQATFQVIIGIAQVVAQRSIGLYQIGELPLDPAIPGVSIVWGEGLRLLRAYGLSDHPNILGGCLAFSLISILGYFGRAVWQQRVWLAAAFLLGCCGLALTFSRSAWLAFAVGGLFCLLWNFSAGQKREAAAQGKLVLSTAILLLPLLWQIAPFLGVRLNLEDSFQTVPYEIQSLGERLLLIKTTGQVFTENSWGGIGLGALPIAMRQAYPEFPVSYQPAHFVLLDVAAETGLVGAICYLTLMIAPWLALWINRKKFIFSPVLGTACALLLAAMLIGMFDYYTWSLAPGRLWQWMIWGLWAAAYHSALREKPYA